MYYIYEIVGTKVGVTQDIAKRQNQQKDKGEMVLLETHNDIYKASERERELQAEKGYRVDKDPYWYTVLVIQQKSKTPQAIKKQVANTDYAKRTANTDYVKREVNTDRKKIALKNSIAIVQYSLEGKPIRQWPSIALVRKTLKITTIVDCLKGRTKTAGGYVWKYAN